MELKGTVTGVCRDPKDEPILECAERAEAKCIVTATRICCRSLPTVG
jgi:predicted nucleic acid-binding protein